MRHSFVKSLLLAGLALCTAHAVHAQGRGPGGPRPGGGGMSMGRPGFSGQGMNGTRNLPPGASAAHPETNSTMRGGLQLGPPGRWWDNKSFSSTIGLRHDQQKNMDRIFDANKPAILETYRTLQQQEAKLETISKQSQPDKAQLFAAIDAVNQARSSLEKVNTQMLLQIRQEMDAEQLSRMEKAREVPAASATK